MRLSGNLKFIVKMLGLIVLIILQFNFSGKEISKRILTKSSTRININTLAPGIYFVKVVEKNGVQTSTIIKQYRQPGTTV